MNQFSLREGQRVLVGEGWMPTAEMGNIRSFGNSNIQIYKFTNIYKYTQLYKYQGSPEPGSSSSWVNSVGDTGEDFNSRGASNLS